MLTSKLVRILLLSIGLLLVAAVLLLVGLHRDVTLVVDGESRSLSTYALTVGSLLASENLPLASQDMLEPGADTALREGMLITLQHAVPVQIFADGELHNLLSAERLPTKLLSATGIALLDGDVLFSEGHLLSAEVALGDSVKSVTLQVQRSLPFTLLEGSQTQDLNSSLPALGQALWKTGVVIQTADHLRPAADAPLTPDMQAVLNRAQTLTIRTAAADLSVLTAAKTVGEALADAGLALQGLDYSNPAPDQPIPSDKTIKVVRVQEEVVIENTPLEFETAYEPAPDLELDSQTILQTGEYGLTAHRIRIRYEDGQEISRQVEDEWVARQPQPRIVGYGTNIVKRTLATEDGTIEYYRALTFWATAYSPQYTGGNTTTASGKQLRKGLVGVNYHYIPFGTMMYVPGYGFAEAADTGLIGPRWIDLGFTDEDFEPWHQYVTVYFLWPPPDNILWIYP
jgi:uncharacterized protein YabE (DUF348 family)